MGSGDHLHFIHFPAVAITAPIAHAHSAIRPQPVSYTHLDVYKRQSLYCINERLGDAVGHFRRIAFFQAVVAFADGRLRLLHPPDKGIAQCPPRHANRALNDGNILLLCPDVRLFISLRRIALLCRHEPAGDLHAIHPQGQGMGHIFIVKNTARGNDRDGKMCIRDRITTVSSRSAVCEV